MSLAPSLRSAEERLQDAKVYAALSGNFDPRVAVPADARSDEITLVAVASGLAAACDTNPDRGEQWLIRTSERRHVLQRLKDSGQLAEAVAQRRAAAIDQATDDLLHVLEDTAPFSRDEIAYDLQHPPSQERIERIIVALDRAGPLAKAADLLPHARSSLAQLHRDERRLQLHERGFFGREAEKERLKRWLRNGQTKPPVRAAFLSGLPGMGKSALLEEVIGFAEEGRTSINVRLDFDRAGLNAADLLGLTMEVARQVAERLGPGCKPLLDARLGAASLILGEEAVAGTRQSLFPHELASEIAGAVAMSGRPVTLILDTLEVVRGRGETHPFRLFQWIDRLVAAGMRPVRVIAAGRGDALDSCPDRAGERIDVDGLDHDAALALLDRLGVPRASSDLILELAAGNPLVLRLGAEVATRYGSAPLKRRQLEEETASAFLYRFLVSRVDPSLQKLAHPGLIVRRISAAVIREVLAPELGLGRLSEPDSERLFEALAGQPWLVARDRSDPLFLVHRDDIRPVLLPLLYGDDPGGCARINAACVRWFGRQDGAQAQVDAAYCRLQLMRTRREPPFIAASILRRFDPAMIAELPPAAQQLVARATGGRTGGLPPGASTEADDEQLSSEVMNLLDRQDWAEGQYVVDRITAHADVDARSRTADAIRAFWWGAGRWADALRLLAERDRLAPDDEDLANLPWPLAIARVEMRAEFQRQRLPAALARMTPERLLTDLGSGSRPLTEQGALAAWLAVRGDRIRGSLGQGRDANGLAAAFEQWGGQEGRAFRQAMESSRERLLARGAPPELLDDTASPQLVAAHSPYVRFAANLATQGRYGWLFDSASEADRRLSVMGGLLGRLPGMPLSTLTSSPIAGIAGLGLFAEWMGALGFTRRDANLRALGRAAERWRRMVAGRWSYGRAPAGWASRSAVDAAIERRVVQLIHHDDPHCAALDQLGLWLPGSQGLADVQRRLAATLRAAAQVQDPLERAARLQRVGVPSAFVPALAVLAAPTPGDAS